MNPRVPLRREMSQEEDEPGCVIHFSHLSGNFGCHYPTWNIVGGQWPGLFAYRFSTIPPAFPALGRSWRRLG
jgi:hypothetical protein